MKLALLTPHLSDDSGGFSQSIPKLANSLAANSEISVQIIGVQGRKEDEGWRTWHANIRACRSVGPRAFGWVPSLPRILAELRLDIVDAQGLWMYPSLACLHWHRRTRHPYLVTPRGMLDPWSLRRSAWKKRIVSWWYQNEHLRGAACLRATSALEASHFRAFGLRNPIAVVPNGIDVPELQPRAEGRATAKRILFLSRIHPKKGIDFLLRCWTKLERLHSDWELVIAGPDEVGHRGKMVKLAEELGVRRVHWLAPVYGSEKSALYRSSDLFVLPTHAENFGLVMGEALAHEVPVITTRNAPWEGLEQHGCGWWIELSDQALTSALDEAMRLSDKTRREMGARGRAWVDEAFAWPAIGRHMAEVYEWVNGGGVPPASVIVD